jgi:hypothetical protein
MSYKSNKQPTPQRTCDNCHLNLDGLCLWIELGFSLADRKRGCPFLKHSYDTVSVNVENDRTEIAHQFQIIPN